MNSWKIDRPIVQLPDARIMPISKETRRFHSTEAALIVGKTIGGPYRIERVLGNGGMSTVYEANDSKSGAKVAIKIYNKNQGEGFGCGIPGLVKPEFILKKASAIARIEQPNIVKILDAGIYDDRAFVVMELLDGVSLQSYITYNSDPSWNSTKRIVAQICAGLDALHKAGIAHMDVKPSNFFLNEKGIVKVFDFDISFASFLEEPESFAFFIGSEHYASPEQFNGARYFDPRIDIYSLGIVMYELACGRHPFESDEMAELLMMHTGIIPAPPSAINPLLPPEADSVIMKAIEKKPEMRFQNAEELKKAVLET